MASRLKEKQSEHDAVIAALYSIYVQKAKYVWTNPSSQKNKDWNGRYIDVIIADDQNSNIASVIEVETYDSVSKTEAENQWTEYDKIYSVWYLAVPKERKATASVLTKFNDIKNCKIVSWEKGTNGLHTFWGLQ